MLLPAVVNTPSQWALIVGSMVLLARTVPFVVIVPTFEEGVVLAQVGAVERKHKP